MATAISYQGTKPRARVRRSKGRRASDRRPSIEAILGAGALVAWGWGIYELTLLFLR
ncbi:MAG: hypothetical protein ACREEW_02555 [Caulobacteraceae bacterium]